MVSDEIFVVTLAIIGLAEIYACHWIYSPLKGISEELKRYNDNIEKAQNLKKSLETTISQSDEKITK